MSTTLSVSAAMKPIHGVVGEFSACFGVDVQAARFTPAGELIRVEVDLLDDSPLLLHEVESLFGGVQPLFEGGRQFVGIGHDVADARPI